MRIDPDAAIPRREHEAQETREEAIEALHHVAFAYGNPVAAACAERNLAAALERWQRVIDGERRQRSDAR